MLLSPEIKRRPKRMVVGSLNLLARNFGKWCPRVGRKCTSTFYTAIDQFRNKKWRHQQVIDLVRSSTSCKGAWPSIWVIKLTLDVFKTNCVKTTENVARSIVEITRNNDEWRLLQCSLSNGRCAFNLCFSPGNRSRRISTSFRFKVLWYHDE